MKPELALKFSVLIDERTGDPEKDLTNSGKALGHLTFYSVPRAGEKFLVKAEDGGTIGYIVKSVSHYTHEMNVEDEAIGQIIVTPGTPIIFG